MATLVNPIIETEAPLFAQYTITATATALSSSGILNTTRAPARLTVRNATGAANPLYLGRSIVTNTPANAGIQLAAGEAYTFYRQSPAYIYIVGTANAANIAFITAEYADFD